MYLLLLLIKLMSACLICIHLMKKLILLTPDFLTVVCVNVFVYICSLWDTSDGFFLLL